MPPVGPFFLLASQVAHSLACDHLFLFWASLSLSIPVSLLPLHLCQREVDSAGELRYDGILEAEDSGVTLLLLTPLPQ